MIGFLAEALAEAKPDVAKTSRSSLNPALMSKIGCNVITHRIHPKMAEGDRLLVFLQRLIGVILFAAAPATQALASQSGTLQEFQRDCRKAGESLWGLSLCAPVVVVDPKTGQFISTEPAPAALPAARANTAFDWEGRRWVMLLQPLYEDEAAQKAVLFHEAWHAHQASLNFPASAAVASHLDGPIARYLIRLEWTALEAALKARGRSRRHHIAQALAFRARRIGGDPKAAEQERDQMRHEGLASYTGVALSGAPLRLALREIEQGPSKASLGRSFAYVSGPAWGILLDDVAPNWKARLSQGSDLPDLMPFKIADPMNADRYGGTSILAEETLAAVERSARVEKALASTRNDRALFLPLTKMSMNFDPNRVMTAPDGSTLYQKITLSDGWGKIDVNGSTLRIAPNFKSAWVSWPLPEDGSLQLADGWYVETRSEGGARLVPPPKP